MVNSSIRLSFSRVCDFAWIDQLIKLSKVESSNWVMKTCGKLIFLLDSMRFEVFWSMGVNSFHDQKWLFAQFEQKSILSFCELSDRTMWNVFKNARFKGFYCFPDSQSKSKTWSNRHKVRANLINSRSEQILESELLMIALEETY